MSTVQTKNAAPLSWQRLGDVAVNFLAAGSLCIFAYLLYTHHPYFRANLTQQHNLIWVTVTNGDIYWYGLLFYLAVLPGYYLTLPPDHTTKSRMVWRAIIALPRRLPVPEERTALLATAIKIFFIPLVLVWLAQHGDAILHNALSLLRQEAFFPSGYWVVFHVILVVDVAFFAIGYSVEHPRLGNEIRSVQPTLLGWAVTIACYPPFNGATQTMLGWYSADYPQFDAAWAQWAGGIGILFFMSIYSWASVALNLKASNLTCRGIVHRGPYAWVRHPAYAAKNLAWWVGSLPLVAAAAQEGVMPLMYALAGVLGWSYIYYLRAVTEEWHLNEDPAYAKYCRRVPYRFIPGVV